MTFDEERIFEKIANIQGQVSAIQRLLNKNGKEEIIANQWAKHELNRHKCD